MAADCETSTRSIEDGRDGGQERSCYTAFSPMPQPEKLRRASLPPVSRQTLGAAGERRDGPADAPGCAFCGSSALFSIPPQSVREWAVERLAGAALRRCHDCGRRQAVAGLGPLVAADWRPGRAAAKAITWALVVAGTAALIVALLRGTEDLGNAPRRFVPGPTPRPAAPSPRPSGPFVLRSTPPSAA